MDEYISKQAFKDKYLCCGYLPEMSETEFDAFPAADVAEVRHGRWHLAVDAVFRCSECGRICYELDAPYCYCGTRMDKETDHEEV